MVPEMVMYKAFRQLVMKNVDPPIARTIASTIIHWL